MTKTASAKNRAALHKVIVQKYGGATLATPQKIKQVAKRIHALSQSGVPVVAAVSAMGRTTNQLIDLAREVSTNPNRRELDMLLTTGERVSMALLTMALHDLGCDAISFTGSQAGILTDSSHLSAFIVDVKAFRVQEALEQNKVVVLAGFQGVSPTTKEITTLGRGGTDTTAVAMAAHLGAERCEILKDVPGVFTGDPQLLPQAKPIHKLSYEQLLEMTFWGAKVLHYRSVELAQQKQVVLYIGPAHDLAAGTLVGPETGEKQAMYESSRILSLNSHARVIDLLVNKNAADEALKFMRNFFDTIEIASPQILLSQKRDGSGYQFFVTGADEITETIAREAKKFPGLHLNNENICTISATCTGVASPELCEKVSSALHQRNIEPMAYSFSAMTLTIFLDRSQRETALKVLHNLIPT